MAKEATSSIKQIEILKSRGLHFDESLSKVKETLLDIGYYRLGFYWHPFEIDQNHNFKEDTKFSNIVKLHYLDVDLRNILIKYINRIEINFRTKLVYYGSNSNKESPTWFANPGVMNHDFISDISKHYNNEFITKNKTIKSHHKKYLNDKYAPAWKTLEFFTFGAIYKVFCNLKDQELRERISNEYGIKNLKKFTNHISTVLYVRNCIAHGGVLFDLHTPKGISLLPNLTFNDNNRHSLDSSVKVITNLLKSISLNRSFDLEGEMKNLFASHKDNPVLKEIIEKKIGYIYDSDNL